MAEVEKTAEQRLDEIGKEAHSISQVPRQHLLSEKYYRTAVEINGYALCCIPEPLRTPELCLAAVRQNGSGQR